MKTRSLSDNNSKNDSLKTDHSFNLSKIYYYKSTDLFQDYLKKNCKDAYGKLAIAKESQLKTKLNQSEELRTPYELLNTSMNIIEKKISKNKLTTQYYANELIRRAGFFAVHIYLLFKFKGEYKTSAFKKRMAIFDYILKYIEKNKGKDIDSDRFVGLLREALTKFTIPKGVISREFYDLINALYTLPKDELINHFNEYTSWLKNQESISLAYLQFLIAIFLKTTKQISLETRSGYYENVNLEISLEHLGLYHGCRLSTRAGDSTVIGLTNNDMLWIKLDNDRGISYYPDIRTIDDLSRITILSSEPIVIPQLTLKLIHEQIILNNLTHLELYANIDGNEVHINVDISQHELAQFRVNLFDRISTNENEGTIIGIYKNQLVICYDKNEEINLFDVSSSANFKIESINEENLDHLIKPKIKKILDFLFSQFTYSFPRFGYANHNSELTKNHNIFHELNYYMGKKCKKLSGRIDKNYTERLLIFNAILKFLEQTAASEDSFSKILKNNLDEIKIPKGLLTKNFYKKVYSLPTISYKNLVKDYLEYSELVRQNTDFILHIHHLLVKLFKMLKNDNKDIYVYNNNKCIVLDTSHEALYPFGCDLFAQITTPHGKGIVLGVDRNNLILLLDKRGLSTIKSTKNCSIIPRYHSNEVDNPGIEIPLPAHVKNIFFPSSVSGISQNEVFNISCDILDKNNLQFMSTVNISDGKGFVLGMWNKKLMVYVNHDNNTDELLLTSYDLLNSIDSTFSLIKNKLEDHDIKKLIKFLLTLSYKLRSTFLMDCEQKLTFKLDLLQTSNIKSNHSTFFNKFKDKKDQLEQMIDKDDNLQVYNKEESSSFYTL